MTYRKCATNGLNPYSNGMIIERNVMDMHCKFLPCLNPYSNGMIIEHAYNALLHRIWS